jgi:hypothetical protein
MRESVWAAGCLMPAAVLAGAIAVATAARSEPGGSTGSGGPDARASAPAVLGRLAGSWDGKGELFGKPAVFRMEWSRALGGRFHRLEFSNAFAPEAPEADPIPVLSAMAMYRTGNPPAADDGRIRGTWFDSRGVELPLAATASESTLVVLWGSGEDAEQGRTTYAWTGPGTARVTDEVMKDGAYQVFAAADYWRSDAGAASTPGGAEAAGP